MAATLQAIAKKVGVSHMTVSRVLNNKDDGRVSPSTRERVLEAVREAGYRPNRAAQALVNSGKTKTVALWVRDLSKPYFGRIAGYLESICADDGYEAIVRGRAADRTTLAEWPVDGIIAFDSEVDDKLGRPTYGPDDPAFVSADVYVNRDYDHVYLDLAPASRDAVLQMAAQGCRRIAHVGSTQKFKDDSRWQGYLAGINLAELQPELIPLNGDSRRDVVETATRYFEQVGIPDGFVCRNDEIATGLYYVLRQLGVSIPEDACIIGCDGTPEIEYFDIPLSTIDSPIFEVCRVAWQFLKNRMQDPYLAKQSMTITAPLVVRASSNRELEAS
ncbi:MAG: LacI family DNA-binding transcriptional regulator [Capsulimonadaceae bacterium]|nr:LacI family DNA-binding transcriptional regulator [Capsulimonadaceae bacterium]